MDEENSKIPLVSITFPIHQFHQFAKPALESLLQQDYPNIEIMFLDNSQLGLKNDFDFSSKRVKYFRLPETFGLAETLNFAFDNAQGTYMARMDHDDISEPNRISRQVQFMESNPSICISGTGIRVIGESIDRNASPGNVLTRALSHSELELNMLVKNAFFHPTVIFRLREIRKSGIRYRSRYDSAEDLDFWVRACRKVQLANIEEPLLQYRLHPNQYSRLDGVNSSYKANLVRLRHAVWLLRVRKIEFWLGIKIVTKLFLQTLKLHGLAWQMPKFHKFR